MSGLKFGVVVALFFVGFRLSASDYQLMKSQPTEPTQLTDGDPELVADQPATNQEVKSLETKSPKVRVTDQKKSQERIAAINMALGNPQLDWNEFEKLLNERRALEEKFKDRAVTSTQSTSDKN